MILSGVTASSSSVRILTAKSAILGSVTESSAGIADFSASTNCCFVTACNGSFTSPPSVCGPGMRISCVGHAGLHLRLTRIIGGVLSAELLRIQVLVDLSVADGNLLGLVTRCSPCQLLNVHLVAFRQRLPGCAIKVLEAFVRLT